MAVGDHPGDDCSPDPTGSPPESAFGAPAADLIHLFECGDVEIEGRMPYSSNTTLLVTVNGEDLEGRSLNHQAIYKPGRGERPLWDFPSGLYKREVAMYRLDDALGFGVIPPTALAVGPLGEGSFQAFVNADFSEHYFTIEEAGLASDDLRRICLLDLMANNTDRKSGHCLLGRDGHVYGIDNGLAFHHEWKLRTVLWDYVDEPIPPADLAAVEAFVEKGPGPELWALLEPIEVEAILDRATALVEAGRFPADDTDGRRYPWPLV